MPVKRLPFLFLFILLFAACETQQSNLPVIQMDVPLREDGRLSFLAAEGEAITEIAIEIAETEEARTRGLMNRRSLNFRQGMLFIFDRAEQQEFWMRNTPLPLDIMFVSEDGEILNIARRTTPMSDTRYSSEGSARYVVEVRAGFSEQFGIEPGTKVEWRRAGG